MQVLTSPRNPLVKEVRRAVSRGGLTPGGLCVAEGFHLLEEALRSDCQVAAIFAVASVLPAVKRHVAGVKTIKILELPDDLFDCLSTTETSQGLLTLVRPPSWTVDQLFRGQSLVVVLDGVQDPGNGGTILRSAEAFGATGVVFLKGSANPYNPKCVRASAGSVFRIPLITGFEERLLLTALDQRGVESYALAPGGTRDVADCHFERRCALMIGAEGRGVSERLRSKSVDVRIPTITVESLNAATAAGIALYEARRQRMIRG